MYDKSTFGKTLDSILKSRGITQRVFAEQLNTTEATVSRYCSGARIPDIASLVKIAGMLNVTVDYLLGVDNASTVEHLSPDAVILVSCLRKASIEQARAIWSVLNGFGLLAPEQYVIVERSLSNEKESAG